METWWINDKVTEDWIALLFRKRSVTCFSPWQFLQLYPSVFDLRFEFRPLRSHYNRLHYCSPVLLALSLPKAVFDRFYPRPFLVSSADLSPFFSIGWLLRGGEMRSRKCPGGKIRRGEFLFSFFVFSFFLLFPYHGYYYYCWSIRCQVLSSSLCFSFLFLFILCSCLENESVKWCFNLVLVFFSSFVHSVYRLHIVENMRNWRPKSCKNRGKKPQGLMWE